MAAVTGAESNVTSYAYDRAGNMIGHINPMGRTTGCRYDLNGRLQTLSSLAGTVTYAYSSCCGRLQSVTDPQGRSTTLSYDANGNRTGLSYPNGTSVSYGYDVNNSLTQLTHRNSIGQVMASYAYTLGPIGNRTRIDESDGIVRQYEYDKLYRLTKEQVTDPANVQTYQDTFSYDAVGNRLNRSHDSATVNYTYNNADQLITESGVTYTYDLNGNLESRTDGTGTTRYSYDFDGRLVKVTLPQCVIAYAYDADGNRVEATTPSGTTRYLVDTNRRLSQVLSEYTPSGSLLASYVYADDLISMTRGGKTSYYHFDGLGSTRLLTDGTGSVTDTYAYDAFGNLIAKTGTTDNPFLFTGQQYDANIGFYHLRARYYQPTAGRFNAVDPFEGDPYTPISLHKYLYAAADPVNKIDPSGEFSIGETMAVVSMIDILSGIGIPSYGRVKLPRIVVKDCKRDLDIFLKESQKSVGPLVYHSFISIDGETFGFRTTRRTYTRQCWVEGPGYVDWRRDIEIAAEMTGFMNGSCQEVSCRDPEGLRADLRKEAIIGTDYYYCFYPTGKKGINCQKWNSIKLQKFCR